MRLAIVNLTSGGYSGGYKKYLERMLPLLRRSNTVSTLDVFSPQGVQITTDSADSIWCWPKRDGLSGFRALKSELKRRRPDVVFVPTARLVKTTVPSVVMVRNMEPLVAPFAGNSSRESIRNLGRRYAALWSCRHATRVIAVSPFVRDFVVDRWSIDANKVGVVVHGVEKALPSDRWMEPKSVKHRVMQPMIFTAGSIRPARGLDDFIGALNGLRSAGINPSLVIAGAANGDGRAYQAKLQTAFEAAGHAESIVWAGSLSEPEMAWCYANCDAFVMTSRVEACPNTALEALAYGAPCIATTCRPMPETFGEAATYYNAGDTDSLATQLVRMLRRSDAEKDALSRIAASRAGEFTWEKTARDTIRQLQCAASTL